MINASPAGPKSQLETLQARLSTRQSILHFAHAAVSTLLALTAAGAAAKMHWDYDLDEQPWTVVVIVLATVLFVYGAARYALGRRELARELALHSELLTLRRSLSLDDPAHLHP